MVLPGPDLTAPECDLAALENENAAMARARALISKVVHSRGLRPLPPTPRKNCRRVVSGDVSEAVLQVALGNRKVGPKLPFPLRPTVRFPGHLTVKFPQVSHSQT